MSNSFYITLPSNVKSDFFDNTAANFKTKLAQRIDLKGDWEVGLASISYTNSWYNLQNQGTINIKYFNGTAHTLFEQPVVIYQGRYDTINDLINLINLKFSKMQESYPSMKLPELYLEEKSKIVSIKLGLLRNRFVFPELSENICNMLGFKKKSIDERAGTQLLEYAEELNAQPDETRGEYDPPEAPTKKIKIHADKIFNLSLGYNSIYVYCDVVKHSFVGDSLSPLLRFVEIPPNYSYGEQVVCTYPDTHYIPLITNEFETIEIAIRNDIGDLMPFVSGRSIIVLHFRTRN